MQEEMHIFLVLTVVTLTLENNCKKESGTLTYVLQEKNRKSTSKY
jgi:hypothetical protein